MIIYAPKSITDAVKSRPDWSELEATMKKAYGADWRLVSYDEMKYPEEAGEMEDSMETEYISRKELIVWLMPYLHFDELVAPERLLADIRAMKAANVVPVVRCRDCKHYVKGSCNAHSVWPDERSTGYDCRPDDDFCSYGERKES